jgi:aminoglycoside phosphotransferase (APT) family kinase protein
MNVEQSERVDSAPRPEVASCIPAGAELDPVRLARYLDGKLDGVRGTLVVEQFAKGYSNLSYLLRAADREYVLRRPALGAEDGAGARMGREYRLLAKLAKTWARAPHAVLYCEDPEILGAPFYVMNRIRGVILRSRVRGGMELGPERMRRLSENVVDTLAELHALDYSGLDPTDFPYPEDYVKRQLGAWAARYDAAQTDDVPALDAVWKWLRAHAPRDSGVALLHNDFKYDNLVLDAPTFTRVVGVLDWEVATLGDPLVELGTTLSFWVQADDPAPFQAMQVGPTHLRGSLRRAQIIERYEKKTGRDVTNVVFYYAFALYKLAVVAQEILRRMRDGVLTPDGQIGMADRVRRVAAVAVEAIGKGRIDRFGE